MRSHPPRDRRQAQQSRSMICYSQATSALSGCWPAAGPGWTSAPPSLYSSYAWWLPPHPFMHTFIQWRKSLIQLVKHNGKVRFVFYTQYISIEHNGLQIMASGTFITSNITKDHWKYKLPLARRAMMFSSSSSLSSSTVYLLLYHLMRSVVSCQVVSSQ